MLCFGSTPRSPSALLVPGPSCRSKRQQLRGRRARLADSGPQRLVVSTGRRPRQSCRCRAGPPSRDPMRGRWCPVDRCPWMRRGPASSAAWPVHECIADSRGRWSPPLRFLFPARFGAGLAWTRGPRLNQAMEELVALGPSSPGLAHLLATNWSGASPESAELRADATGLPWNNRWGMAVVICRRDVQSVLELWQHV